MAGLSKADAAIEAKVRTEKEVPVGFLFLPKKNDKNWGDLWHPRGEYPPDPAIVQDIIDQGGVEKPVIVWQQVAFGGEVYVDGDVAKKGDPLLIVGDGSQRTAAAVAAQAIMKKKGMLPNGKHDLFIPITKFMPASPDTAEREFLLLRQAHDADRLKKPHKASVIAWNLHACKKKGASDEELLNVCPKDQGWTKAIVDAALQWGNLTAEAAKAFDDGVEIKGKHRGVPITLLPVVLEHSVKTEQVKTIVECLSTGITSMKGWTRRQNAERSATDEVDDNWETESDVEAKSGAVTNGANANKPKKDRETTTRGVSGRRPKARVQKALDLLDHEETELGDGAEFFRLGMSYEIGNELDMRGLPAELKAFLAGISWVTGNDERVPRLIADAYDRANDKSEPAVNKPKKQKRTPEVLKVD